MEDKAVSNFRQYIRCNTMHPNPNYGPAMAFLSQMAKDIGLKCTTFELVAGNPICLMTWEGSDPSLPSILLNSHTDVVPVFPEHWRYEPFEAVMTDNGDIYGRGTQDMKCVGIQYLEAIRILKSKHLVPLRTVHLSFVPDEEVGGCKGMVPFLVTPKFQSLNVGFALDEGMASPTDTYVVYYGERSRFVVDVTAFGNPGHGSQFVENTAGEKLHCLIGKFMEFRKSENGRLLADDKLSLGDVTTANLTMINGGVQTNVIPSQINVKFDVRVSPLLDPEEFKNMVLQWGSEAGIEAKDIAIEFFGPHMPVTAVDGTNPFWVAFKRACDSMNMKIRCEIFPAATDSRYLRGIGVPAIGFSPMINTPILLHDHNEFLNKSVFMKGIEIYTTVIQELARLK